MANGFPAYLPSSSLCYIYFHAQIKGEAEAYAIEARAKAEAEQMAKKADAWKDYQDAAMIDMVLETLPKVSHIVGHTRRTIHIVGHTRHKAIIRTIRTYHTWKHQN